MLIICLSENWLAAELEFTERCVKEKKMFGEKIRNTPELLFFLCLSTFIVSKIHATIRVSRTQTTRKKSGEKSFVTVPLWKQKEQLFGEVGFVIFHPSKNCRKDSSFLMKEKLIMYVTCALW